jgi:hypothetical protein
VLPDRIREDIEFELGEIDLLFELYQKELFDMEESPNLVELTALAGVLHSFYNGIDKKRDSPEKYTNFSPSSYLHFLFRQCIITIYKKRG